MPVMTIRLRDDEVAALAALARAERRRPGDQAALLLARALVTAQPAPPESAPRDATTAVGDA
jgi:hypothetical protein